MKRWLFSLLLCLFSVYSWAANGDITACRIKGTEPGDGWVLQIDVESSGGSAIQTGGTYAFGLGTNNDPSTAKVVLTVTSPKVNPADDSATTTTRTIYGTRFFRKPFFGQASGTLTSTGDAPSDGDQVTIDTKTYTFKTALTPTEGEVLIGGSAEAALTNLKSAINHTGTPNTDYKCAAVHTTCWASTLTSTTLLVLAKADGTGGNAYSTTTPTGTTLSWGGLTLSGGETYVETADESLSGGTLTLQAALDTEIYSDDTLTVSIASGLYTQGEVSTAATTDLACTNNSTMDYSDTKPVGKWLTPMYEVSIGDTYHLEVLAGNKFVKEKHPLAAIKIICADEHSNTASATVTDLTISTWGVGDGEKVQAYQADIDTTGFTDADTITCNFKAYPWVGDAAAVLDTSVGVDGVAAPDERLTPFIFVNGRNSSYTGGFAYVVTSGGSDPATVNYTNCTNGTAGVVYTTQAAAEAGAAFATISKAEQCLKACHNQAGFVTPTRNNPGGGVILLAEGTHDYPGGTTPASGDMATWVTIKPVSTAARASTIIGDRVNAALQLNAAKIKVEGVTITAATALTFYGNSTDLLWVHNNLWNSTSASPIKTWKGVYATQNIVTAMGYGFQWNGAHGPYFLIRGNTMPGNLDVDLHCVVGNRNVRYVRMTETTAVEQTSDRAIYAFNSNYALANQLGATNWGDTLNITGLMIVGNVVESLYVNGLMSLSTGTATSNNIMLWNNTFIGERVIIAYNWSATSMDVAASAKTNYSLIGNSLDIWAIKTDTFQIYNFAHVLNWGPNHMLSSWGNVIRGPSPSVRSDFDGLYSVWGQPAAVKDGLQFVNDASLNTGTGLGNGNYRLKTGSTYLNVSIGRSALPYDLDGKRRRIEADDVGAYVRGLPKLF
jgi:hypothetical protein